MEVKIMAVTADDGKEYQTIAFRDSEDVQEQIDAATKDLQEQLTAAQAAKEAALASVEAAREEGILQGEENARAECAAKHFTAEFTGDGGTEVTLSECDFDPDFITIRCFRGMDEYVQVDSEGPLQLYAYDKNSTDDVGGMFLQGPVTVKQGYNITGAGFILCSDANSSCVTWDEVTKTLTIKDLVSGSTKTVFGKGLVYRVVAVKTEDQG